jgi:hypothetical protein
VALLCHVMLSWLASMLRLGQVQEGRVGKGEEKECVCRNAEPEKVTKGVRHIMVSEQGIS